jgi:hypothetical protein
VYPPARAEDDAKEHLAVSRTYNRSVNADTASADRGTAPDAVAPERTVGPWVRYVGRVADVDVRILSDRTPDGGSVTRLVDGRGKRLHPGVIVGRPGREDEVALTIATTVTALLRGA